MKTTEQYNLNKFFRYYFFMALSLSLCASWSVTDLLLLKMDFDLTRFGIIKGHMFLLPAITYFAVSKWIGKLNMDIPICILSYFLRCALPLILPVTALLTKNQTVLLWTAVFVMAGGYTCAMFANNTLMKLIHTVLPEKKLNRYAVFFNSLLGLPGYLISIPAVWFLVRFGESRTAFLLWFTVLQFGTLLCEIPGILALRKLRFRKIIAEKAEKKIKKGSLFNTDLVFAIIITTFHGLWLGLLSTYFVVYLIKNAGLDPALTIWIDFILSAATLVMSSKVGKLIDAFGYPVIFSIAFFLMTVIGFAWGYRQNNIFFLILFAFLIYNGNSGFLAAPLRMAEMVMPVRFSSVENSEIMMGLCSLMSAIGCFAGCESAGIFYEVLGKNLVRYFEFCVLGALPIFVIAVIWYLAKKNQPLVIKIKH